MRAASVAWFGHIYEWSAIVKHDLIGLLLLINAFKETGVTKITSSCQKGNLTSLTVTWWRAARASYGSSLKYSFKWFCLARTAMQWQCHFSGEIILSINWQLASARIWRRPDMVEAMIASCHTWAKILLQVYTLLLYSIARIAAKMNNERGL